MDEVVEVVEAIVEVEGGVVEDGVVIAARMMTAVVGTCDSILQQMNSLEGVAHEHHKAAYLAQECFHHLLRRQPG